MEIQIKGVNPNETYCCTKEDVKSIFGNADIEVYFGIFNMSRNEKLNSQKYKPNKKCNDRIIARMVAHKRCTDKFGLNSCSYLSFFIMSKEGYTDELRMKFVSKVLPELKMLFEEHKNDNIDEHGAFTVTIGLKDNCYNFYKSLH